MSLRYWDNVPAEEQEEIVLGLKQVLRDAKGKLNKVVQTIEAYLKEQNVWCDEIRLGLYAHQRKLRIRLVEVNKWLYVLVLVYSDIDGNYGRYVTECDSSGLLDLSQVEYLEWKHKELYITGCHCQGENCQEVDRV